MKAKFNTPTPPLTELKALCKEAGVRRCVGGGAYPTFEWWDIYRGEHLVGGVYAKGTVKADVHSCRQNLKAYCLGLIAMRKAGELEQYEEAGA